MMYITAYSTILNLYVSLWGCKNVQNSKPACNSLTQVWNFY